MSQLTSDRELVDSVISVAAHVEAELEEALAAWQGFFEPGGGEHRHLGVAIAGAAVAKKMRRAVGLDEVPGVLIVRVKSGSAADTAGLSRGDLITAAAGTPVRSVGDL